jgi:hypothetical protein
VGILLIAIFGIRFGFSNSSRLSSCPTVTFHRILEELAVTFHIKCHNVLILLEQHIESLMHGLSLNFASQFLFEELGFDWREIRPDMPINEIYDGAFAEQFVGQEFICSGSSESFYQRHYWYRGVKGSEAEVDYVIVHKGCVAPVEVKSGSRGALKSLTLYQEKFSPERCFVLSMQNSDELEQIKWVPLFLASQLLLP